MKLKKIVAFAVVVVFCLLTVCLVLPSLPLKFSFGQATGYQGFLDFWHIETFEGGSANRASWLKRRALEFEKQNSGLLIHITTLTYEQAQQKLSDGDKFDIISFSYGTGFEVLPYIQAYGGSVFGVFENFLSAGEIENTVYAVPYMTGVYGLFARQSDLSKLGVTNLLEGVFDCAYQKKVGKNTIDMQSVGSGFGKFNSPLSALPKSQTTGLSFDNSLTQYQAYQQFVNNRNFTILLGTQRDLFRLQNRLNQSKMEQLAYQPLDSFCDLAQFASISKTTSNKSACIAYLEYLLSKNSQNKLTDIGMFSVTQSIYSDEWYKLSETALLTCQTANVFTSPELLKNQRGEWFD